MRDAINPEFSQIILWFLSYFNGNASVTGGIVLQPFLYELSQPFGKYQPGTILLSGNRIPGDFSSTNIQLYASTDKG